MTDKFQSFNTSGLGSSDDTSEYEVVKESTTTNINQDSISRDEIIEKIKNFKNCVDEPLVFKNISVIDYNYIYRQFAKAHQPPRYNPETSELYFP